MLELGAFAREAGFVLEHRGSVGSTSGELMNRGRAGNPGPEWLVADEQTEGRGRREREWVSPPGNLYASLLLADPGPAENIAQLSLVFGLALWDAVDAGACAGSQTARLKWPNDLMIGRGKCAGILLEGGRSELGAFVVAGFGVNLVSHPDASSYPVSDLAAEGYAGDRDAVFARLSASVPDRLTQWDRGRGIGEIRTEWLKHAWGIGEIIQINAANESFAARLMGLDGQGRLLAERNGTEVVISAGEVFALGGAYEAAL